MTLPPDAPDAGAPEAPPARPTLEPIELRILGCLVEKQITTPDVYPLSLNGLVVACNQTTNRDPVTHYDESAVTRALAHLRDKGLVWSVSGSRVAKFEHRFREKLALSPAQLAAMCVLMLRGPQTAGEIRGRSGRLHAFADLAEVDATLESLRHAEPPLVTKLPRAPGTKEARYAHLLGGAVESADDAPVAPQPGSGSHGRPDGLEALEHEVTALRADVEELGARLAALERRLGE